MLPREEFPGFIQSGYGRPIAFRTALRRARNFASLILLLGCLCPAPAPAADGGYPHTGAVDCSAMHGKYAWCVNGRLYSSRGYAYRNCTDWAAWRLQQMGASDASTRGLGHGGQWGASAGSRTSSTPLVGRAAVTPSTASDYYGHVAVVEAVHGDGRITVSEYNADYNGTYRTWTGHPASRRFTQFVDFGITAPNSSVPVAPGPGSPEGSLDHAVGVAPGQIAIAGWTRDPDSQTAATAIHVYVDGPAGTGVFAGAATANVQRDDVAAARPGAGPHHGFALTLGGYPGGNRSVYVYAINAAGPGDHRLVGSSNVTIPSTPAGTPEGAFDGAYGTFGGSFRIQGWTLDPDAPTHSTAIHVYLDGPAGAGGRFAGVATADVARPDVGAARPGAGDAHGFDAIFGELAPGTTHTAYVYAINAAGDGINPLLRTITFSVPGPSPLVAIDHIGASASGFLTLSGWTVDPDAPSRSTSVHVYLDDKFHSVVPADLTRPDVPHVYGLDTTDASGYSQALGPLPPGRHKVQVFAINIAGAGANDLVYETFVDVPAHVPGSPEGAFDVAESGVEGDRGAIRIRGWAIDPDDPTQPTDIHVYADAPAGVGKIVAAGRADRPRPDVAAARPGTGENHGFDIPILDLSEGTRRTFYVYAINRAGGGENPLLGSRSATMPPAPPAPAPVHAPAPPSAPPATTGGTSPPEVRRRARVIREVVRLARKRLRARTRIRISGQGVTVRSARHLGRGRYRLTLRVSPAAAPGRRHVILVRGKHRRVIRRAVRIQTPR